MAAVQVGEVLLLLLLLVCIGILRVWIIRRGRQLLLLVAVSACARLANRRRRILMLMGCRVRMRMVLVLVLTRCRGHTVGSHLTASAVLPATSTSIQRRCTPAVINLLVAVPVLMSRSRRPWHVRRQNSGSSSRSGRRPMPRCNHIAVARTPLDPRRWWRGFWPMPFALLIAVACIMLLSSAVSCIVTIPRIVSSTGTRKITVIPASSVAATTGAPVQPVITCPGVMLLLLLLLARDTSLALVPLLPRQSLRYHRERGLVIGIRRDGAQFVDQTVHVHVAACQRCEARRCPNGCPAMRRCRGGGSVG